ncbi:MAG: YlmC/YmxH family sporulation protein [Firmicutes bacterium]|nr:YlmC/YmxH family sporulation protein [Bacillota bacterium]MBR6824193.1 YlmC/YmxH family sporulation protein [Bacillota bacterium]MBR7113718.1 YlmC/YmxH family sporulation protein [Bacillota bacterium]
MIRVSELRRKDVIDNNSGQKLGYIRDVDMDPYSGRILTLLIPGSGRWKGLWGRSDDLLIQWQQIVKIGMDVILVDAGPPLSSIEKPQ